MEYYKLYLLKSSAPVLTYKSNLDIKNGFLVLVPFGKNTKVAIIVAKTQKPDFDCKEIKEIKELFYPSSYQKIMKFISTYYSSSYGRVASLFSPFHSQIKYTTKSSIETKELILSPAQKKAFNFIQKHKKSLLFGDTGSGKTEIYIKCIYETLKKNKSAIVLMPEISLTPQITNRLKLHFKDTLAIWHSKISKKKKEQIIEGIHEGSIQVVIGARSALFLPLQNLGLIVVDEEHDDSYKSNQSPRYHARDLALYFTKILNVKVILGSATPSLFAYANIAFTRLKGTYFDSQKEFIYTSNSATIPQLAKEEIAKNIKNQAIVFVPTRANFKYIICPECDFKITCPYCSVGMSVHHFSSILKCHYCSYTEPIIKTCPECGCEELLSNRIGTQEVVDELKLDFKNSGIEKFDKDSASTLKKLKDILKRFNEHQIDILVGTQMLSKGHDYHNVKLAVILGIDYVLNMADFKARERALSLVLQIAGRSGRKGKGRVVISTSNEEFFKSYMNDYEKFLKDELKSRVDFYPPFVRFMRILISHKSELKAKEIMNNILATLNARKNDKVEIVGYGASIITKVASKFRYNILLRSKSHKELLQLTSGIQNCEIDMDPVSFN